MTDTTGLRDAIAGWEQGAEDENISLDDRLEQGYALCEAAQALLNELPAWFVNEDGGLYSYKAGLQEADFPNDDHVPYPTRQAALRRNWPTS